MRSFYRALPALVAALFTASAYGAGIVREGTIKLQDLTLVTPDGWRLAQEANSEGTVIALFTNDTGFVRLYVKRGTVFDPQATFVYGSRVDRATYQSTQGRYDWSVMETKASNGRSVVAFWTSVRGNTYYGYGSASDVATARASANAFLNQLN